MSKTTKITIDSYNKTAEEYYKIVSSFELLPELEKFVSLIDENGIILDLGCGPGHHSRVFLESGFNVKGVDLSTEMIAIAKKEVVDGDFEVMDIQHLKFKSDSFDGIWASASLLHIPKNNLKIVLKNLYIILAKEGILYISLKKGFGSEILKDTRYGGVGKFYVYYQSEEIKNALNEVGFEIIDNLEKERRDYYDTNSWIHIFCKKE